MLKYKVGDKVKIVNHRVVGMNSEGLMDKWCGKIMTIDKISEDGYSYFMKEDGGERNGRSYGWSWDDRMIECKVDETIDKKENKSSSIKCTELIWVDGNGVSNKLSAVKNMILETKMINLAFVKFDGNSKVYVFLNPTDQILKKGIRVLVDTKYGEKQATVLTGIKLQEQYLDNLLEAIEATKPLKYVLGIVRVERFEVKD